jgi:sugar O-acyltransferase (sialic acid O-acetyltransferase NeuD family)
MTKSEVPRKKVVVFGTGGQARCASVGLIKDSPYEIVAFTAHEAYLRDDKEKLLGLDVVPFERIEELYPPEQFAMFIVIGYEGVNRVRAEIYEDCKRKGYELVSYVSSRAMSWDEIRVGENCLIAENTVIHPFTTIGNNVVIGSGCTLGHDVTIGDHCFLASNAVVLGCVTVEPYCFLGANSTINNGITIARESVVGAGAFINKSTQERGVYICREAELMPKPSNTLGTWLTWSAKYSHQHAGKDRS